MVRGSILHVDDDAAFLEVTKEYLMHQHDGFTIETTTDPEVALTHLKTNRVDCIVSDYDMPDCNGIELLKRVRSHCPDTPFILFTGKGGEDVASQAISAGVTDYIQKQVGTEQYELLANRIRNAVESRRLEQSVQEKSRRLERLSEVVPSCVIEVAPDGEILFANRYAEDILGLPQSDVVGQRFPGTQWELQALDGTRLPENQWPNAQITHGESTIRDRQIILERFDGTQRVLSVDGAPLYDDCGDMGRIVLSLHDITDEHDSVTSMQRCKEALQEAYRLIASESNALPQQIDELLAVAKRAVETEYATFARVDENQMVFKAVAVPGDDGPEPGDRSHLETLPPCRQVVETEAGVVIDNIEREAPKLVSPQSSMTRHLGVPVQVDGETYGTLCFYDTAQSAEPFTEWQEMFVDILADWVGARLEQVAPRELRVLQ